MMCNKLVFAERQLWNIRAFPASVRLDACEPHHLGPLLGFLGDQLAEVSGRTRKYRAAEVSEPRFHVGIGEAGVDLLVYFLDYLGRRGLRGTEPKPLAHLVARHEFGHGRNIRQHIQRVAAVTASARSMPALIYPIDETVVGNITWTYPASRSLNAGPPPR